MRIAFHVPRASHLKPGFSGDKVLVRGLLDGLARRGHDVQRVSTMNMRNVWRGRVTRDELLAEMQRVRSAMDRFAPDAWLVYGASTTNPDLFGWRMRTGRGPRPAKYVLLAADLGSGKRLPPHWRRLFAWSHRRSLACADAIAAYHPSSRDELTRTGIPRTRVGLLPPAVGGWDVVPTRQEARRRLGLPRHGLVLLCASRFPDPNERDAGKLTMLLDLVAMAASSSLAGHLVVAGDGPGKAAVETALRNANGRNSLEVHLVGAIGHDQMRHFFAACDLFVYPNLIDRPWLAVLEAQSCGRPVVTMRTRSAELTVRDGDTGLLASDAGAFRRAVETLADSRQRRQTMGDAATRYVAENHSLDVRIDEIERMLRDTLERPKPPEPASVVPRESLRSQ